MQKKLQHLLLITSYKGVYQEKYKIPIHSLWHAIEVLSQPLYVMSLCKSAIGVVAAIYSNRTWVYTFELLEFHISVAMYSQLTTNSAGRVTIN